MCKIGSGPQQPIPRRTTTWPENGEERTASTIGRPTASVWSSKAGWAGGACCEGSAAREHRADLRDGTGPHPHATVTAWATGVASEQAARCVPGKHRPANPIEGRPALAKTTAFTSSVGLLALLAAPALGHEITVRTSTTAAPDEPVAFQIESTHTPGRSEEIEDAASLAVTLIAASGSSPVAIAPNDKDLTQDGRFTLAAQSSAVLHVHRLGMVWSETKDGWKQGGRDQHPDALQSNKYEKFTKVLVNSAADPAFASKPVGDALEIVPQGDPSSWRVGELASLQVLYDGKPLPGALQATYLGFTDVPSSYAWATKSEDGVYKVKLTAPGMWLARVEHQAEIGDGTIDRHVMRAILQFEVR